MNHEEQLLRSLRSVLAQAGDAERGLAQQAYMKSAMPYYGLTAKQLTSTLRPILAQFQPSSRAEWETQVRQLWDGASHREERYAALAVARQPLAAQWYDVDALPLFEHLIVTGAWWDYVDAIAAHLVGSVLAGHRTETTPIMREWSCHEHLWIRRTAVLCQLRHKSQTDRELLRDTIENNLADPTFWLRKAIGWALREFARTDPDWVRSEVARWGDRLSGLSRREALKHLA